MRNAGLSSCGISAISSILVKPLFGAVSTTREPDRNDTFSTANRSDSGTRERRSSLMRVWMSCGTSRPPSASTPSVMAPAFSAAMARRRTSALVSKAARWPRAWARMHSAKACTHSRLLTGSAAGGSVPLVGTPSGSAGTFSSASMIAFTRAISASTAVFSASAASNAVWSPAASACLMRSTMPRFLASRSSSFFFIGLASLIVVVGYPVTPW